MIQIRPFKRCDAEKVASWVTSENEFYMWSAGILGEYPVTPGTILGLFEETLEDPGKFQMIAYDEDGVFGHALFRFTDSEYKKLRLGFIIINPERRGKGLGSLMVKTFMDYAYKFLGVSKITLGVFEQNMDAYRAYLAAGFYETPEKKTYDINGEKWTCIELENFVTEGSSSADKPLTLDDVMVSSVISENLFGYAFQPIVRASSGKIYGYEALMRAECDGQPISPMAILSFAKDKGKMYDIEKLTLFNVMSRYEAGLHEFKDRKIYINSLPGYQLNDNDYAEFSNKFRQYFDQVVLEVTEHNELNDSELDILLKRSSDDGFGLAIDDYGTGFSNTASLLRYLPNCVKIDRLLITNVNEDNKKKHFVRGIVEFAHTNGFYALAEGVETEAELKTVIELGVDLIQGFYLARPSFEIIDEIPEELQNQMINFNVQGQDTETRKVYVMSTEAELPLMRVALEQNTGMLICRSEASLIGNTKYCAEMSIKIRDGLKCRLTIRDVFLESFMQLPCLELGENVDLTLVLEGENRMRKAGILVPESSKIRFEGDGNLQLRVQGIQAFGIGNVINGGFGSIEWAGTGALDILVEADEGVGIGGGYAKSSVIQITDGTVRIEPACQKSVAIGCAIGSVPIMIDNANVQLDLKTDMGIGIGSGAMYQNTKISNSKLNIICAGARIATIGNNEKCTGRISIIESDITIVGNGQYIYLVGSPEGDVEIEANYSTLNLRGEGNEVLAIGTKSMEAKINMTKTTTAIKLSSGTPVSFGARAENTYYLGGSQTLSINE